MAAVCRHRKLPPARYQSLVIRAGLSIARCTKGIVYSGPPRGWQPNRRGITYGTDFRHTVEFSRSGRTPSRAFRTVSGQPQKRYSVGFAVSTSTLPRPFEVKTTTSSRRFPSGGPLAVAAPIAFLGGLAANITNSSRRFGRRARRGQLVRRTALRRPTDSTAPTSSVRGLS